MTTSLLETLPRKVPEFSPVDGRIRQDEVREKNTAPRSVVICDDDIGKFHLAIEEGADIKMQMANDSVNRQIRKDEVREANLAPCSVMISEDVVRNVEMIHPAAKEGAGVAVTNLLKVQKVNGAVNTAYVYKPIEGNQIIDFKKVFVVIQYSY